MPVHFKLYGPHEIRKSDIVLLDVRRLVEYRAGHIPDAISLPFANMITIKGLAFDVPAKHEIENLLSQRGITGHQTIVAYDNFFGKQASRFIYTLEIFGHRRLGLLDRTFHQYTKEGGRLEGDQDSPRQTSTYSARPDEEKFLDKNKVLQLLDARNYELVDARVRADYEMGRLPGSINIPWTDMIGESRILRPRQELERLFERSGLMKKRPILTYCDEGTSSALMTYALRSVGYVKVINYYLSYGEWGADPRLPRARKL